jgi:hypothetical protein
MPNPAPNTKGLTRGKGSALEALGVEPLKKDEVSKPVRIRASAEVHKRLQQISAKEIGDLMTKALLDYAHDD